MSSLRLAPAERRATLLQAAVRVAKSVTSILDPDQLLQRTVDIICDEFGFYYAGVFLLDETGEWAVLHAGRSAAGAAMVAEGHKLAVGGNSMIGAATGRREARIALDVGEEAVFFKNPYLPETRSEMALPLVVGGEVIGALTVQSIEEAAFTQEDIATLQIMTDQLAVAIKNSRLHRSNQELLQRAEHRARLFRAANQVGRQVASILDLDQLLLKTVDIICDAYMFYYAGVFLIDETGQWAVLRAGHGKAGATMIAAGHKLEVGGNSMIGAATSLREARIALDVGEEAVFFRNPYLPHTRSEMALPLVVGAKVLGAVTVQSIEERAFSADDITALQIMADHLAIAIHNAQVLQELEQANAELVRTKTFEAIATATGEAIHWVGNKAAPIPGSVGRISEDLVKYLSMVNALLAEALPDLRQHKFAQLLTEGVEAIAERGIIPEEIQAELERQPLERLRRMLSIESIFEDLFIIQTGANAILNIKEDLMGPARKRKVTLISLPELLREVIAARGIPSDVLRTIFASDLPLVRADRTQLDRVFVNLIKNAMEAMESVENQKLVIWARRASEPGMIEVDIIDNGAGIPPDQIDKVWVAFYTTKGDRGGTGLGLPACLEIIRQSGGKIRVESEVGQGTTFTVSLPAAAE